VDSLDADIEQRRGEEHGQRRAPVTLDGIYYIPLDEIRIGKRHRKDLGDIDGLARSIDQVGLLHPILARSDGVLIAGARRLAAFKLLGLPEIPVCYVNLDEILIGESAENICRKKLSPSEIVAIGRALQELERENARQRQIELGKSHGTPSGKFPEGSKGQSRDKVAAALGLSGKSYQKAVQIVEAAEEEPERFGHLVEEMDRVGKIDNAYRKLRRAKVEAEERLRAAEPVPSVADANARDVRRYTISLPTSRIDALVRKGLVPQEQRHDHKAVRRALTDLLLPALQDMRDARAEDLLMDAAEPAR
jgi:ParB-like chromosome segregation protein Spo0J